MDEAALPGTRSRPAETPEAYFAPLRAVNRLDRRGALGWSNDNSLRGILGRSLDRLGLGE
jgi:hypothetical protein